MSDKVVHSKARLLVCVGPNPGSADLIRAAKNMADAQQAEWFAVYVEDARMLRLPEAERNRAVYNLRLAEQLTLGWGIAWDTRNRPTEAFYQCHRLAVSSLNLINP